jgi:hypothetical protein
MSRDAMVFYLLEPEIRYELFNILVQWLPYYEATKFVVSKSRNKHYCSNMAQANISALL